MALYLEEPDVEALAATGLTDGSDDKKIDFIYLDHDTKRLIFAQGFFATKLRDAAPAGKASDLNTAAAWLLSGDLDVVPETIRLIIAECREALAADELETIELLYLHNLPKSVNVTRELQTAEEHLRKALGSATITIRATELGQQKFSIFTMHKIRTSRLRTISNFRPKSHSKSRAQIGMHMSPLYRATGFIP